MKEPHKGLRGRNSFARGDSVVVVLLEFRHRAQHVGGGDKSPTAGGYTNKHDLMGLWTWNGYAK